jgi:AsmA protein
MTGQTPTPRIPARSLSKFMPRPVVLALALAVAVILGIGLMPWPLARAGFDQRIISAMIRATGLMVETAPGARVALLPTPRILLTDAIFRSVDGTLHVESAKIRADIRILPLFAGQIVMDGIELASPQITLGVADGAMPPLVAAPTPTAWFSAERETPRISLKDGSLFIRETAGIRSILRDMNFTLAERSAGDPLVISGALRWRGEAVEITANWPLPQGRDDEGRGKVQTVFLRLVSGMGSVRFEGLRQPGPIGPIEGRLEAETGSLPQALDWMGESSPFANLADKLRLSGEAVLAASSLTMPNISLSIDADRLDGAALVRPGANGVWGISATLDGARLDIDRMLARSGVITHLEEAGRGIVPLRIARDGWRSIDLRLSLVQARLAKARLSDVALQFLASADRLDVSLARATAYKGTVKGRLAISAEGPAAPYDLRFSANAERIDVAAALADMGDMRRLSGTGFLQATLDGSGENLHDIAGSMKGRASLVVRQGEITGISLADLARRAERQPLAALREGLAGRSAFENISLAGPAQNGVIELSEGLVTGAGYRLTLGGGVSLPGRNLRLKGVLAGASPAGRLPFEITGPWGQPRIAPDLSAITGRNAPANGAAEAAPAAVAPAP